MITETTYYALLPYLYPRDLPRLFCCTPEDTIKRMFNVIVVNAFRNALESLPRRHHRHYYVQLSLLGVLPPLIPENLITNDRYGFIGEKRYWVEWEIVKEVLIYRYFTNWLTLVSSETRKTLWNILHPILLLLNT